MKNIMIGFVLIFLDFSLNLGNSKIGLIPDFAGYIVMANGLIELADESPLFIKVKPFVTGMAIYSGILYVLDLLGISVSLGMLTYVLAITSSIVALYISYNIVMGVMYIERNRNTTLNGESLKTIWTVMAVFNILTYAAALIPVIAVISVVISVIISICFLFSFNNSKNMYYNFVNNHVE